VFANTQSALAQIRDAAAEVEALELRRNPAPEFFYPHLETFLAPVRNALINLSVLGVGDPVESIDQLVLLTPDGLNADFREHNKA